VSEGSFNALPVLRTVGQAHVLVLRHKKHFLTAAILPTLLMAGAFFLHGKIPAARFGVDGMIGAALFALPLLLFSLHWLRGTQPAGAGSPGRRPFSSCAARFTAFALPWFLAVLLSPFFAVLSLWPIFQIACWLTGTDQWPSDAPVETIFVLWIGIMVLWYLLAGRLMPALPAVARQSSASLREAWRQTRSQGLRISASLFLVSLSSFLILVVIYLLFSVLAALMAAPTHKGVVLGNNWVSHAWPYALITFAALVATALISSVLDLAQRHLSETPDKAVLERFE
jgi:hypothetical protein